jgi:hypothetical protein
MCDTTRASVAGVAAELFTIRFSVRVKAALSFSHDVLRQGN